MASVHFNYRFHTSISFINTSPRNLEVPTSSEFILLTSFELTPRSSASTPHFYQRPSIPVMYSGIFLFSGQTFSNWRYFPDRRVKTSAEPMVFRNHRSRDFPHENSVCKTEIGRCFRKEEITKEGGPEKGPADYNPDLLPPIVLRPSFTESIFYVCVFYPGSAF